MKLYRWEQVKGPLAYAGALLLVVLATLARLALDPYVGDSVPYVTYFLASAIAIRFTGAGPSVLTILLGTMAADWFFLPPRYTLTSTPAQYISAGVFFATNLIVLSLARAMRQAKERAEANAQAARERAALLDLAPVLGRNLDDTISIWGQGAETIYGFTAAEALGRVSHDLLKTQFPQPLEQIRAELLRRGEWQGELAHQRKDGATLVVLSQWVLQRDGQGQPQAILETNRDITERKRAEEALRQREAEIRRQQELLAVTLASIGDAVIVTNTQGRVTFLNGEAERLTGWATTHAAGQPLATIFNIINEKTRQTVENPVDKALQLGRVVGLANHTLLVAKDGREIPIDDSAAPIRQADGTIHGVVLVFRDITERKRSEDALLKAKAAIERYNQELELRVEERTVELKKMVEELEHFSYTITHDMRAPLRAMQGFGNMLLSDCADCPHSERRDLLGRIATSAGRMDSLIIDSLQYTKVIQQELHLEPIDPAALLQTMVESYPQFQPPTAEILIERNIPRVLGNQAGLTQCFSNLLGNAVKFVHPGTVPKIRVRGETRGDDVRLWFEDNGIGIAERYHGKIFVMFQRLSKNYEGTGIGLALVRKVVQRMRGKVGVESQEGQGSRFWVDLKRGD